MMFLRIAPTLLFFSAAILCAGCARQNSAYTHSDLPAGAGPTFARAFLLDRTESKQAQPLTSDSLAEWADYARAIRIAAPEERESALRQVHGRASTPSLKGLTLRAQSEDPAFQS